MGLILSIYLLSEIREDMRARIIKGINGQILRAVRIYHRHTLAILIVFAIFFLLGASTIIQVVSGFGFGNITRHTWYGNGWALGAVAVLGVLLVLKIYNVWEHRQIGKKED